jgi:nucleotide-binding universal stress UspA family protein
MATHPVVVGVDGSIAAVRALDHAAQEALRRHTGLEIVYAVHDLDESGPVLTSVVARVRARHPVLPVTVAPVTGDPADALVRRSRDAALTVVGTRGLGGFAGLLLGSISLRLAAHAHGPVMVVRGIPGSGDVLLGVESDADADAAAYAFAEAARRRAPLRVLHAWSYRPLAAPVGVPPGGVQDDIDRRARAEAAVPGNLVAALRDQYPQVGVETDAVRSGPAHALLEASRKAGLVVVAAHRRPARRGLQLGPVTHALLHHAHCPVVLVPAGELPGRETRED